MTPELIRLIVLAMIIIAVVFIFIARQIIINEKKIKISKRLQK